MFGIFISQRISIDGINVFSIGLFFFIVQLLEKSVTAKEEMELDLFGKVRYSYFMSHWNSLCPQVKQTTWENSQHYFHYAFSTGYPTKCHYPDLGSASNWLMQCSFVAQPIRNTTQISVGPVYWCVINLSEFLCSFLRHHLVAKPFGRNVGCFLRAKTHLEILCRLMRQKLHGQRAVQSWIKIMQG